MKKTEKKYYCWMDSAVDILQQKKKRKIGRNCLKCLSFRPKHGSNLTWSRNFMT